jgi:transcriptional regulator
VKFWHHLKVFAMYVPPAFAVADLAELHDLIRASRLGFLVTRSPSELQSTPLPFFLDAEEGEYGTLYGHLARANPQWKSSMDGQAMVLFMGPNAYITPSWYATKEVTGKVVPTWNYVAVEAHGTAEFFDDAERLLNVVTRLTRIHEQPRDKPWAVGDAPMDFIKAQLRSIVGLRMPIVRVDGKRKMSQNRNAGDRAGVIEGLSQSNDPEDVVVAGLVPR